MFEVRLSRRARRYYERASTDTAARLDRALGSLEVNPFGPGDVKPLRGMPRTYRLRVGDLRIVFEVDREARVVNVLHILPRGDAY
ncbi:MAG: type II toxin-antitoxin system RelE/ParE family toxin [Candidatus Rokubacteria bacterium]|nr:type II toxin-antitoxin system RelE/ParE family toxin [Candidatus Rokubacteria bacterium]